METSIPWSVRMANHILNHVTPEGLHPKIENKWAYVTGMTLKSFERVWERTGNRKYYDFVQATMERFVMPDGSIRTYRLEDYNLDQINQGKLLFGLMEQTSDPRYEQAAHLLAVQLKGQPRTDNGGFWHKKRYPYQMWLDGLYMSAPFLAQYAKVFGKPELFDEVARQILTIERQTRDPKSGLLYHGWDESREQVWANPETGTSSHFWSRAMGWYAMAVVDALEHFPLDHPKRGQIAGIFERMAGALARVQDSATGLWYQVLDQGQREGNYLEASGSGMFVYAMAKGSRLGYLSGSFRNVAGKGYQGMLDHLIETDEAGIHLTQICAGAGLSADRDGSYEYYISEPVVKNSMMGVAPFILASVEMETAEDTHSAVK